MAYVVPTPADLAGRFPGFGSVDPARLAIAIGDAQARVDQSWMPGDYGIAIMLLAAHTLTLDGLGPGAESAAAAAGVLGFQSLRSGPLELRRQPIRPGGSDPSSLAATSYGRRFLALLTVNQPPIAAV